LLDPPLYRPACLGACAASVKVERLAIGLLAQLGQLALDRCGLARGSPLGWATAYYGGLRLGELRALRFDDLDLDLDLDREPCPLLRVERSWDEQAGIVEPKSGAGVRQVPVVEVLRRYLREHRLAVGRRDGFLFARDDGRPFATVSVYKRADRAWRDAGLDRITLHECRHSFVSRWLEAGVPKERVKDYVGHAQHDVTERYRHVSGAVVAADAALVSAYLARETAAAVALPHLLLCP
jgi:integrase